MSSYFARHKQALNQNKSKVSKVSNNSNAKSNTGKLNSSNNDFKNAGNI
jgi:hypothetical protein